MKTIKVSEEVHGALQDLQKPRESLSAVIIRLLAIQRDVAELLKKV